MSSCPHEFKTFLLTVSTKDPVTLDCQEALVKYVVTNCAYSYVVTETGKSGKLHVHAMLVFERTREKRKLQENITMRIVRVNGHPEAKNGLAVKVTTQYNHKWYDEYLKKESDCVVLHDTYDRSAVTSYFPTEAAQDFLIASKHHRASDEHIDNHVQRWITMYPDDSSSYSAARYLYYRMYKTRDLVVMQDKRRLSQLAQCLHEYRTSCTEPCYTVKRLLDEFTGFTGDYGFYPQHSAAKPVDHERI